MKRSLEEAQLNDIADCGAFYAKFSRTHYDSINSCHNLAHLDDCVASFTKGMKFLTPEKEQFEAFSAFVSSKSFWSSILSLEQTKARFPSNMELIPEFDKLQGDFEAIVEQAHTSPLALVITSAVVPYKIEFINQPWTNICEFEPEEVQGQTLALVQGPLTDRKKLSVLHKGLKKRLGINTTLVNYTKSGRAFVNKLRIKPVRSREGDVTHFVGLARFAGYAVPSSHAHQLCH